MSPPSQESRGQDDESDTDDAGGNCGIAGMYPAGAAQEARVPQLTVKVRNHAKVPDFRLTAAKSAVAAIFAKARIDATFMEAGSDFPIVLLSRETADQMHQNSDAVGFAPGSDVARGHIAYVLQPRVEKIAEGYGARLWIVLAVAIAHEVGHLLMFNAHSSTGIMRAEWNQADFRQAAGGNLLFTPEQAAQMRGQLAGDDVIKVAMEK
jgi:hypothetical protein